MPPTFLKGRGLLTTHTADGASVKLPVHDLNGVERTSRFLSLIDGQIHGRWKAQTRPCVVGLPALAAAVNAGTVAIVPDDVDALVLTYHGIPAIAVPTGLAWTDVSDAVLLDGVPSIVVVTTPESTSRFTSIVTSRLLSDRLRVITLGVGASVTGMHRDDPATFVRPLECARQSGVTTSINWRH